MVVMGRPLDFASSLSEKIVLHGLVCRNFGIASHYMAKQPPTSLEDLERERRFIADFVQRFV